MYVVLTGAGGSSVITVTRVQAGGYQEGYKNVRDIKQFFHHDEGSLLERLPFHYINHVRGADRSGGSSVITVTRVQAGGYEARKRDFSPVFSLQIGTETHKDFF